MSKFTELLEGHPGTTSAAIGRLDSRVANLLNRSRGIGLHPTAAITIGGLVFIALTGWANFQAAHGFNFEYFYLFGCAVVGWIGGVRAGFVMVVPAAILLLTADLAKAAGLPVWIIACNAGIRFTAFTVI